MSSLTRRIQKNGRFIGLPVRLTDKSLLARLKRESRNERRSAEV